MKKSILAFLLFSTVVYTQPTNRVYVAYDYEAVTVAGSAIGFTATKIQATSVANRAELVTVSIECSSSSPCDIRYRIDGQADPSSSVGTLLSTGATFGIYGFDNINRFRAIRTGANSASLRVTFYR